ncbi:MAG: LysR family transcriptional regulator [Proteobacteria bacterium]|nr:LysR family transcriptional regulator [Pseudomonadota bacterium]MCP4918549.1 LysR family transcriptional regulator [Pseudomonadota bacterium]
MPDRLLDLNALARFAAVVKHQGFSPAARAIGTPRQSLHRTIDRLESELGVRLLNRSARRVRPTDTGRRLYQHALRVLTAAQDATALARSAKGHPQGLLRVSAPPLFGQLRLGDVVRDFLTRWPEVRIEVDFTNASSDLFEGEHDLAIRIPAPPSGDYIARRIGTAQSVCCAAPSYLAARAPLHHPSDLDRRHERVVFGAPVAAPWRFRRGVEQVDVHADSPRLRVDDFHVMAGAVVAGLGVGLVPGALCTEPIADGRLIPVLDGWTPESAPIWAAYSGRARENPTLLAFIEMLEQHMAIPLGGLHVS